MIMKVLIMSVTAGNGHNSTAQAMIEEFEKNGIECHLLDTLEYINKHFCDADLSISNVCCKYYISKSTAQRLFLKNIGISPKQYLLKLRMEKAMFLLSEGDFLIKDIALQCGFKYEKYFSRIFQEKIGYLPSQLYKHHIN